MTVDTTARNVAADAVGTLAARMALHTADPGAGSANELSGGGYSRQAIEWDAASGAVAALSDATNFDVPAVTVAWVSIWNAAGTVRYGKVELDTPAVFPVAGVLTINAADLDFSA